MRLDQALSLALPQYSRSRLAGWIQDGAVRLDGTQPDRARRSAGQAVRRGGRAAARRFRCARAHAHQDRHRGTHLFVIDKPAGLVVHPGAGNPRQHAAEWPAGARSKLATVPRAGIVHRIDKDTSGLLVVARTIEAHPALVEMLRAHQVQREYQALCVGAITGGGTVDAPIGRHRTDRLKMAVRPDGKAAVTHYRLAERFAHHTLLHVQLETGRTHQIRVHLAHIGHPLVGDPQYGGRRQLTPGASPALREATKAFGRQALHAGRLAFEHPVTGKAIDLGSPLPLDFRRLLAVLREG
ncbi:MAG: RluA family pseudouridine synthase [Rhodanobacteraceae bacterium]|nr:RluA family pseudouridine synthase [Rhodanobacteraceae bacterium]